MDTRTYITLVKYDHPVFGRNEYVKGLIAGFLDIICGITSPWGVIPNVGQTIRSKCTEAQYEIFRAKVEKRYPGLCEFDLKVAK